VRKLVFLMTHKDIQLHSIAQQLEEAGDMELLGGGTALASFHANQEWSLVRRALKGSGVDREHGVDRVRHPIPR
jgi:hypothetical protein